MRSPELPALSLRNLAVRGAIWTVSGFGAGQVLRLGFNLILTRLLFPELFGLMALVSAIVTGVNLFGDLGIAPAVVRDPRGDDVLFLNTAWTLQIIRGFALALFLVLLAHPVAFFYGDSRLTWILPVMGLISIATGLNSTSVFTLQRHMAVKRLVLLELTVQAISGAVMITWAKWNPGVWALIAGSVVSTAVRLIWSHFLIRGRKDRIAWEQASARTLIKFGRWIWIASILTFLASQIDRLIFGKLLTLQMLGIYSTALVISEVPRALVLAVNSNVIYPAYAKSADLPRSELRAKILRHRWSLVVLMACCVAVLAVVGDAVILALYDRRYAAGSWMLPLLALGIWPGALAHTIDSSLFAIGQPRYAATANLCKILFTAGGIPIAFSLAGTAGAVIVVALNDVPYYCQIAYGLWREHLDSFAQDLKATALLAAILVALLALRFALGFGIPIHP